MCGGDIELKSGTAKTDGGTEEIDWKTISETNLESKCFVGMAEQLYCETMVYENEHRKTP